jgi:hypothetical protein
MDKLGIRATLYDLVGYILPGLVLLSGLYFIFVQNARLQFNELFKCSISLQSSIILFIAAYIIGHIVATVGSIFFENRWFKTFIDRFYKFDTSIYDLKSKALFGYDYNSCGERTAIAFCQEKHPILYDVAFIFLSIYGFSRNIAVVLIILTTTAIIKIGINWAMLCISLLCIFILLHNYLRFKQYFAKQIASALMISDQNSDAPKSNVP